LSWTVLLDDFYLYWLSPGSIQPTSRASYSYTFRCHR